MSLRALAFLPLLAALPAHAAPKTDEDPAVAKIRKEIEAARKKEGVVGMSVAVVKDGKVILCEGFGQRDAGRRLRATGDTVYAIGSSTKSFTSLLVTQAAQDRKLALSDRPSKYLPAFRLKDPDANAKITIEDMMSHRSGLPRTDFAWYAGDFSRDDLLALVAQEEPTAPLGKAWQYQNLMFLFSGMIAEKAYGEPYENLLRDRYFTPLGMAHSGSTYAETRREGELATGYAGRGLLSAGFPLPLKRVDAIAPAGTISSSARDMAKYLQMLLAGGEFEGKRLFSKEAIEETRKPRIAMPGGQYALGWMIGEEHGAKSVFHGGNIDGFTAMVSLVPEKGIGVVALSNGNVASLPTEAAKIVYDNLLPAEKKAAGEAFEEAKDAELGAYRLAAPPVDLVFTREGKQTFLNQNGAKLPLEVVGPKRYTYMKAFFMTFGVPGADGKPTVKLEQGGVTFSLLRAEPYKSPLAAEDLLAKAVEAQGGADAIRRHARMVVHYHLRMPSDAVDVYGVRYRRDADSVAEYNLFYALNRRFAESTSVVADGRSSESSSFTPGETKSGAAAKDDATKASLEADLDPRRYYRSLEVVREDKVGAEPVFVLRKTGFGGEKTEEYVSKKDYRLLRRVAGSGLSRTTEEFSDFRTMDGLTMPFHAVTVNSQGGRTVEDVTSVRFDEPIPAWPWDVR